MTIHLIFVPLLNLEMHATCLEKGVLAGEQECSCTSDIVFSDYTLLSSLCCIASICKDLQKYLQQVPAQVMLSRLTVMYTRQFQLCWAVWNTQSRICKTCTRGQPQMLTAAFQRETTSKGNKVFRNIMQQTESQYSQQTITEMQLKTSL